MVNELLKYKEKTEKGSREEKGMKGLLAKTLVTTSLLIGAFTGSALAYQNKANQSNETGQVGAMGTLVKSLKGQKTHTDFQENTNSCASCHMTHTANAKQLLFGTSTQSTCLSCHDGSLGFYNVKTGELYTHNAPAELVAIDPDFPSITTADVVASNAGSFDRSVQDASMHNVDTHKALSVKAAPGGYYTGAESELTNGEKGTWGDEFSCASCHAPHGSYSDRLLHYNPNGMGTVDVKDRGFGLINNPTISTTEQTLGYPVQTIADITGAAGTAAPTKYKLVKATKADHVAFGTAASKFDAATTDGTIIIAAYKAADDEGAPVFPYTMDTTPWLNSAEYPYTFEHQMMFKAGVTMALDTNADGVVNSPEAGSLGVTPRTTGVSYNYAKAYASGAPLADVVQMRIPRVSVVDLDLVQVATYLPNVKDIPLLVTSNAAMTNGNLDVNGDVMAAGGSKSGMGVKFSQFCAACHVDYLASSGAPSGHYNNNAGTSMTCNSCHTGTVAQTPADMADGALNNGKFRHTTNSDNYSCARCHMSHGANALLFKDSKGADYASMVAGGSTPTAALAHLDDINPSSAIKRYTNMSVCWGCHTSSHASSLVNNDEYQNDATKQVGLKYGSWDANASWTAGNRWGFGKPAATPSLVYISTYKDTLTGTSANSGKYDDFYPQTGVLDVYPSGGPVTVQKLVMEFNSWGLLASGDKVTSNVVNAADGTTVVGTVTFDAATKQAVVSLTTPYVVNGTNPAVTYNFTIAGKLYTVNLLTVKP
ncbi:MAG: doubled domain protein [Bacillales bacterium]|jgi:predicted CXXCH cytochrome family protein|nr:doubled domain protein [Bacillales bacterium]